MTAPILLVGAGTTGLAMACELSRDGARVAQSTNWRALIPILNGFSEELGWNPEELSKPV
jgi:NADPH-dependent 2,4-dienoyl-CoA reductase/sulfur reductase-like enzyme